jgi:hypothetical protein
VVGVVTFGHSPQLLSHSAVLLRELAVDSRVFQECVAMMAVLCSFLV